jgi:hypothetical protein
LSAAEMVGRLLERYALSMDEIEVRSARCVQLEVPIGGQRRRPIDGCVPAIARFCDCKVWLAPATEGDPQADGPRPKRYIFFGFETDAALARYLYQVIERAIATETTVFKQANPRLHSVRLRKATGNFQHGLVDKVAARLETVHEEREASVRAQRSAGTALMLVKHHVVDEAFREADVRLVSMIAIGPSVITKAYQDGMTAGERVNLSRPVTGEGQGQLT